MSNQSTKPICFPWELTEKEFKQRIIPSAIAVQIVQVNRAGTSQSKNKGYTYYEPPTDDLIEVLIPLSIFTDEYIRYIEESTDEERVTRYQTANIQTPIYIRLSRKGKWVVSDGGHRLLATYKNGEYVIRSLVPASSYAWFMDYYYAQKLSS